MRSKFVVIRPYGDSIRKRVFAFLFDLGYDPEGRIEPGTPNDEVLSTLKSMRYDLLLCPYHLHKDNNDQVVEGIQVLELLCSQSMIPLATPILMPISDFEYASQFGRRHEELQQSCPELSRQLIPMQLSEIGSDTISEQIQQVRRQLY